MSKEYKLRFVRKQKGVTLMGVTQGETVIKGMKIAEDKGGGIVDSITMRDGMIYIRKVNKDGTPCRKYGTISMPQDGGKMLALEADGMAFPASMTLAVLFDEVAEPTPESKLAQSQQAQQQVQKR